MVDERPTAVRSCSLCTNPEIKDCRAETANEKAIPLIIETLRICHGAIIPATEMANRPRKLNKRLTSETIVIVLRSIRSAIAPPIKDRSNIGIIIAAVTIVTIRGEWVRSYITHPLINICMLNPVKVVKPAAQYRRYWLFRRTPRGCPLRIWRTGRDLGTLLAIA